MTEEALLAIKREKMGRTGKLNLVSMILFEVPTVLLDMPWLRRLYLGSNFIQEIKNLDALTKKDAGNGRVMP